MLPLQLIDSFLLNYHVGHVLLLAFAATTLGVLPLKSQRALAANVTLFGLIFMIAPFTLLPAVYVLLGIALILIGPLLWTTASE
ncbi:hypothetical protein [Haloparvum sedimenti]|uniref:hypothetical protein n=1 Tax=Haloparvum sedimenti TaxID=1678448 RepID=UPI00071E9858|nr:hypothetical protein [Haloparvum sedimenti]